MHGITGKIGRARPPRSENRERRCCCSSRKSALASVERLVASVISPKLESSIWLAKRATRWLYHRIELALRGLDLTNADVLYRYKVNMGRAACRTWARQPHSLNDGSVTERLRIREREKEKKTLPFLYGTGRLRAIPIISWSHPCLGVVIYGRP